MLELFSRNARHYAKRQMTWFRRDERIRWMEMWPGKSDDDAAGEILKLLSEG
jgi:tRNA dimethylallyltransferase